MGLFSCLLCPNPLDCKQDEAMNLACLLCHHTPAPRAEQGTLDCEKKRGFGLKPNNDPLTGICVWFGGEGTTLRLILCDPMNRSLQGSSVHGILQARILEWVAIAFSRGSSQPRDGTCRYCISCIGRQTLYH